MMNEFIQILPSTLIGWVASVFFSLVAGAGAYRLWKTEDNKLIRQSNIDLRLAHEDNQKQINELKDEIMENKKQITILSEKIQNLKTTNKTLEDLVKSALMTFFKENPRMALEIAKIVELK